MIELFKEQGEYVAWAPDCEIVGFGDTPEEARAELLANAHEQYSRFSALGVDRISRHLAATIPALTRLMQVTKADP